ncbi:MAG: head decoration protein [Deltaproteobacteria bacterium]|jgi:hypothetical protein|nr:head decoration protein [Deltaproteobacteria bacterium]
MADWLKKIPVLSDLLKDEQPRFLGREEGIYDNAAGPDPIPLGTVVQQGAGTLEPWDMSATTPDVTKILGILLDNVLAGEKTKVGVLISGPAAIDPNYLVWSAPLATAKVTLGLNALKDNKFIFARPVIATGTYPEQIV